MKKIKWMNENLEEVILITVLIAMTVIMCTQVCARYIFNTSLSWTEELTRYLFVWSGFLSIGFAVEKKIAIRLEQLTEKVSKKVKSILFILDYSIEVLFFCYLIPAALKSFLKVLESGRTSTAMEMPMWILQLAPLVGFSLAVIRLVQKICSEVCKIKEGEGCR